MNEDPVETASQAFGGLMHADWVNAEDWEKDAVRRKMRKALLAVQRKLDGSGSGTVVDNVPEPLLSPPDANEKYWTAEDIREKFPPGTLADFVAKMRRAANHQSELALAWDEGEGHLSSQHTEKISCAPHSDCNPFESEDLRAAWNLGFQNEQEYLDQYGQFAPHGYLANPFTDRRHPNENF